MINSNKKDHYLRGDTVENYKLPKVKNAYKIFM